MAGAKDVYASVLDLEVEDVNSALYRQIAVDDIRRIEEGKPVGQGVVWSADGAMAWELLNGDGVGHDTRVRELSLEEAAQIAERIGLPAPTPSGGKFSS